MDKASWIYLTIAGLLILGLAGSIVYVVKQDNRISNTDIVLSDDLQFLEKSTIQSQFALINYKLNQVSKTNSSLGYGLYNITGTNKFAVVFSDDDIRQFASENGLRIEEETIHQQVFVLPEANDPADLSMVDKCLLVPFQYQSPNFIDQKSNIYRIFTDTGRKCFVGIQINDISPLQTFIGFTIMDSPNGEILDKFYIDCYQVQQDWLSVGNC
jgi:hypothetical protein